MRTIVAAIFGFIVGTLAEQWATDCDHDKMIAQAFNAGYRIGGGTASGMGEEWLPVDEPVAERIGN